MTLDNCVLAEFSQKTIPAAQLGEVVAIGGQLAIAEALLGRLALPVDSFLSCVFFTTLIGVHRDNLLDFSDSHRLRDNLRRR